SPELREAEHRARPIPRTPVAAGTLQRPCGRLVQSLASVTRRPGEAGALDWMGLGPGHLRAARRPDELRGRPPAPRMSGRKEEETPSGTPPGYGVVSHVGVRPTCSPTPAGRTARCR